MQKVLVASAMFFGLMLALSVPAMADPPDQEAAGPECPKCAGPGDNGVGAVVTNQGVTVYRPNGMAAIFIDLCEDATSPETCGLEGLE